MTISIGAAVLALFLALAGPAQAQGGPEASDAFFGQNVTEVRFEVDGRPGVPAPTEASLRALVEVRAGQPLRRDDVRSSMDQLFALGRYEDIRPVVTPAPGGVIVLFRLLPRYPIDRVELALSAEIVAASALERELRQRFVGRQPGIVRPEAVEDFVHRWLNDDGYLSPVVSATTIVEPGEEAASLIIKVDPGAIATIASANVENSSPLPDASLLTRAGAVPGRPYRRRDMQARLTEIEDELRALGHYEAVGSIEATPGTNGVAITLTIQAGPRVELLVVPAGSLPGSIDELIPIERERSADQDLLEDARARIEAVLKAQGYANASAPFTSVPSPDGQVLTVTFSIERGARYYVERVELPSSPSVPENVLRKLLALSPGDIFDQTRYEAGVAAVIQEYTLRGFYSAEAKPAYEIVSARTTGTEAWVVLHPEVTEGPRAQVSTIAFSFAGSQQVSDATLRQQMRSKPGAPFVAANAAQDRTALRSYYLDRGFLSVAVDVDPRFNADGTAVELAVLVNEGPQITIGRITVIGQQRVSEQQILEEMRLVPGQPMGLTALSTARQRLADMGVFRSFTVEPADRLSGETEGDIVVTVVEAPATTIGFGLGLEGGARARRSEEGTVVEDVIEIVPRGFFEIGRRHLGGRNRAVNLFSRVGLRRSDRENLSETVQEFQFTEYRVTGTYREQHAFRSETDLLVSLTSEQAVRPTYNYLRRAANAEFLRRLTPRVNLSGRYTLDFTRLFDERIPEEDQPLIDRLFPQVRLSYVASGLSWDGRDNPLTPSRGTFVSADTELAARGLGSQVGYLKGFFQALNFRPIGSSTATVLALRGQVGLARGFERTLNVVGPDGDTVTDVVSDLPVSARFFAGGSTTVRGFPLDRLGVFDADCVSCSVINPTTGLSVGGNAVVVLNAEVRRALTNINRNLAVVTFLDGGNVFPNVGDLDLSRIRGSAGFGVRYDSPFGPLRLDFGFKLNRLVVGERRESAWEYHLSIGEAF